jgi:chemosensory pili system protein ChpC
MGFLSWRGRMLSVVNFNSLNDVEIPKEVSARCLVVMNRARTREGPAFYALASNGLPRMLQLLEDDLSNADEGLGVADVMKGEVGTEIATIPNLAYVEQEVALLKADTAEL